MFFLISESQYLSMVAFGMATIVAILVQKETLNIGQKNVSAICGMTKK